MFGAILGDMAGSIFEFDTEPHIINDLTVHITNPNVAFTDDTVMTIAVANALWRVGKNANDETIRNEVIGNMRFWGTRYLDAGYGTLFYKWLLSNSPKPYKSYGNGAAMRISPVGWMYDSLDRTLEVAALITEITHNTKIAVDGAQAVAGTIYLVRTEKSKSIAKSFLQKRFDYDLQNKLIDIMNPLQNNVDCRTAVEQALIAFFEACSVENAVKNAVMIGGDTDTIACIAGSIAEAYYGYLPNTKLRKCVSAKLPEEFKQIAKGYELATSRFEQPIYY